MEVVTILIGVAVFILSALMIYCISAFSMREKTFEEVIEEQRRRKEEEREKLKAEKRAEKELHKKKYKKGRHEKGKEKTAQALEPEPKVEPKMVNLEIEPEIIEQTETLGLTSGLKHRAKKDKATKSILQNKGEHAPVVERAPEITHKPIVPKDEVELKKNHDRVVEKHEKVKVAAQEVQQEKEIRVEKVKLVQAEVKVEKVKVVPAEVQQEREVKVKQATEGKENLAPKKVEKDKDEEYIAKKTVTDVDKRPGKGKAPTEEVPLSGSRLISLVKTSSLTESEVQSLIDVLLNKQGINSTASETWNKKSQKGDPVGVLKKQLEEKEKALQEEQAVTATTHARNRELKNEVANEKVKYAAVEKRYQEKIEQQLAEINALQQRLQHSHDQHIHETTGLQARIKTLEQGTDRAVTQKLTEENKILQDSLNLKVAETVRLTDKLKYSELELTKSVAALQASDASKAPLESKISTYEDKIRKLESAQKDIDVMIRKQVEEVNQELRKAEGKNASLSSDLQKASEALKIAQGEVKALKAKLQELETHLKKTELGREAEAKLHASEQKRSDLEGNVKNLENQLASVSHRIQECEAEINHLQQENKSLKEETRTVKEENNSLKEETRTLKEESGSLKEETRTLQQENRSLKEENQTASERLQQTAASNGDIHSSGPNIGLAEHERIISQKEQELIELVTGVETQKKNLLQVQGQLEAKAAEVADLQEQLSQQKKKNNDLREKNWKAMEALEKAEKSAMEKVDKALKSAREVNTTGISEVESHDRSVLQRIFPEITVSEKLSHKEWIAAFENQALKKSSDKNELQKKLSALTEENKTLNKDNLELRNSLNNVNVQGRSVDELQEQNNRLHIQLKEYETKAQELNDDRYKEIQSDNQRLKSELESYRSIVTETENKLKQLERSIDLEEKKWNEKLQQAYSQEKESPTQSKRIQELENLVSQQEIQMQEYRRVLSHADDRLRELEGQVENEEHAWQTQLATAQSELTQTKNTLSSLKQEPQETPGSQEMEIKMAELQEELKEAHDLILVITKEKETVITQLSEVQTRISTVSSSERLEKELAELRTLLEAERKRSKDLSLNVVKLNGIIKTGQDALSQEQNLVKKLQESLDSKSVNSGSTELEEIDQLRLKLSEKQKLLEREISTNKQLSERLAQLGVLAASTNESGTSV